MTIKIDRDSFTVQSTQDHDYFGVIEHGEIQAIFRGQSLTVKARRYQKDGDISLNGFVGRYQTGNKVWRATVYFRQDEDRPYVNFGRDDNHPKFRKENMIHYAPELYDTLKP